MAAPGGDSAACLLSAGGTARSRPHLARRCQQRLGGHAGRPARLKVRRGRPELQGQWSSAGISAIGVVDASCHCVTPNVSNPPLDRSSLADYSRLLAEFLDANYETVPDPPGGPQPDPPGVDESRLRPPRVPVGASARPRQPGVSAELIHGCLNKLP